MLTHSEREKFLDSHLTSFSLLLEGIKKVSYCMRSRMKVKEEFKKLVDLGIFGGGKEKTCLFDLSQISKNNSVLSAIVPLKKFFFRDCNTI